MNNRLHNGKVVVFTTFYQFFFFTCVDEFRISSNARPHCTRDKKIFVEQNMTFSLILLCNRVVSAVPQPVCCPVLCSWPSVEVLPRHLLSEAEHAHGSWFCHFILALWSLSPFSAGCWAWMCQLYYLALKGCWVWDMCDDMMVPWQQAVILMPDGEFFQGHIRKNSCVVL